MDNYNKDITLRMQISDKLGLERNTLKKSAERLCEELCEYSQEFSQDESLNLIGESKYQKKRKLSIKHY